MNALFARQAKRRCGGMGAQTDDGQPSACATQAVMRLPAGKRHERPRFGQSSSVDLRKALAISNANSHK
jgi:hypothetical protein